MGQTSVKFADRALDFDGIGMILGMVLGMVVSYLVSYL